MRLADSILEQYEQEMRDYYRRQPLRILPAETEPGPSLRFAVVLYMAFSLLFVVASIFAVVRWLRGWL